MGAKRRSGRGRVFLTVLIAVTLSAMLRWSGFSLHAEIERLRVTIEYHLVQEPPE